ncbi:Dabb family protein [uncultured Amnibacterium sp.]|uniref:Dabb family protein n=1 Tax=uncultured Amnibacterium sp. TaxID=1631851 RepID=UPI0035CC626C
MAEIVHVVLVEWAAEAPPDVARQAEAVVDANLVALPGVLTVERGGSISGEGLEDGFDWALVIRFASEQALADYLPHPDHRVVGGLLQASSRRLVVFDVAAR